MHRIVVLGAGYAGLPAVNRIARQTYRDDVELVLVSTRDRFVERPRLHQLATGQPRPDLPLAGFLSPGVRLRIGRVERLVDHALAFAEATPLSYETLLYAAGSTIDITSVPGVAEHARTVTSPESALAIAAALRADTRARVVVCGGGLTGLELAAEVAESFPHADIFYFFFFLLLFVYFICRVPRCRLACDACASRRVSRCRACRVGGELDGGRTRIRDATPR